MRYCNLDLYDLSEKDKKIYDDLNEFIEILEKKNVLEIIHEYCWDVDYVFDDDGNFNGFIMLIDPTEKLYLDVAGGEGYIQTKYELQSLELPEKLNTALYETFEIFYKHGVKKDNILSA